MSRSNLDPHAIALPAEDPPELRRSTSPQVRRSNSLSPAWARRSTYGDHNTSHGPPHTWRAKILHNATNIQKQALTQYNKLALWQRITLVFAGLLTFVLGILFLIYNEQIFSSLAPFRARWRALPAGWLILWLLTFLVSFPPLIGYSTCVTLSGFVFGFPAGWFIIASATIVGSTCSFIACRTVLANLSKRLVQHDPRFAALALTLKHDGLRILVAIRLCPLPYSLSNGAIATFPTVSPLAFAGATAIVSPKLMIHVFVGSKLAQIAEHGGEMDARTKFISYLSIIIGVVAGGVTGWVIYRQTNARARQLEAEERAGTLGAEEREEGRRRGEYADDPEDGRTPQTVREHADDISLRDEYRDDWLDEEGEDGQGGGGQFRDEPEIGNVADLVGDAMERDGWRDDDPFDEGDCRDGEERDRW